MRLGLAVAAYRGNSDVDLKRFEDAADMLCDMATLHGLAHLVLEEKAAHFFRKATSRQFVKKELPKVLERLYPDHKVAISGEKTTLANSCRALPACAVEPRAESDLKEGPVGAAGQVTRLQARSLVL